MRFHKISLESFCKDENKNVLKGSDEFQMVVVKKKKNFLRFTAGK